MLLLAVFLRMLDEHFNASLVLLFQVLELLLQLVSFFLELLSFSLSFGSQIFEARFQCLTEYLKSSSFILRHFEMTIKLLVLLLQIDESF